MAVNDTQRKLTAILSADVKGYSKLMGDDDESIVNTITAYRKIITELINKHQSRVVDSPGDNILSEFGSTLNAVNSAVEIQHALETENGKLPDNARAHSRLASSYEAYDVKRKKERLKGATWWLRAATYAHLGKQQKAEDVLAKYMKKRGYKGYTVKKVLDYNLYALKDPRDTERFAKGLHKAGLPME